MRWLASHIATCWFFGTTLSKFGWSGAGTVGRALGALILYLVITQTNSPITWTLILIITTFIVGWWSVHYGEPYFFKKHRRQKRHDGSWAKHDFNQSIIDEIHGGLIAGLPVVYWWVYFYPTAWNTCYFDWPIVVGLVISFIIFSIIDIKKPRPVSSVENACNRSSRPTIYSLGVILDDTVGAIMSAAIMSVVILIVYLIVYL